MSKDLCTTCPHRTTCKSLCSKALAWADQDYVGEQRIPIPKNWQFRVPTNPEEIAMEAFLLRKQGKSYEDIAIHLECSEHFLREVLDEN